MLSPTTARGLLGHFPHGADPPASNKCCAISAARVGIGGARGGTGRFKIMRDGGGGGKGAEGGS